MKGKLAMGDTIGIPPDQRPERGFIGNVALQVCVTQNNVVEFSGSISHLEGNYGSSEIRNGDLHPFAIVEGIEVPDRPSVVFPNNSFFIAAPASAHAVNATIKANKKFLER